MNRPDYQPLFDMIFARTGLTVDENRVNDIARIVAAMLADHELPGVDQLMAWLETMPATHPAWRELIRAITVGETYFFRNQAHFSALRNHLLPGLIAQRRQSGLLQLRIWSAGCASGEEPYSLAMLLEEVLPDRASWSITILGTDINLGALDRARQGLYRASSFRNETPDYIRQRWFNETADGFVLDRRIREQVIFAPLNLVDDDYPSFDSGTMGMDLIICRNVTIYFKEQTTRSVVKRFNAALNEGGWLVVGHSEPVASIYQEQGFVPRNYENAVFYQKDSYARYEPPVWTLPAPAPLPSVAAPTRQVQAQKPLSSSTQLHHESPLTRSAKLLARRTLVPRHPLSRSSQKLPARQTSPEPSPDIPPEIPPKPAADVPAEPWQQAKHAADRGKWSDALAWLGKADEENHLQPQVHYLRGLVKMQIEDYDGALQALRQAIYVEPRFALAHYTLGEIYEKRHEHKQAMRHWRLAHQIVSELEPDTRLWFAEDLTAEMMVGLLQHRLEQFPNKNQEN